MISYKRRQLQLRYLLVASLIFGLALAAIVLCSQEVRADSLENQPIRYYDRIGAVPEGASGYVIETQWSVNPVTYSFHNCPSTLDCAQAHQAVRDAIETWDSVCGLTLDEVESPGDIDVDWAGGTSRDDFVIDGPGGYLGYSFFPYPWLGELAGNITFDDNEHWVIGPPESEDQIHLPTVALHEVGHALGLNHTDNPDALMWPIYVGVRGLHQDDIDGIQAIYGPPDGSGGSEPQPTEIPGVTVTANNTIRMRMGPSTEYRQVGTLPANASVPVLGRNPAGDWVFVEYAGIRGWVAVWLTVVNGDLNTIPVVNNDGTGAQPADPTPPTTPASEPGGATAISDITLRIRSGPDISFSQIGSLPPNTTVTLQGRNPENTWYLIEYGGVQGWIAAWLATLNGNLDNVPVVAVDASGS